MNHTLDPLEAVNFGLCLPNYNVDQLAIVEQLASLNKRLAQRASTTLTEGCVMDCSAENNLKKNKNCRKMTWKSTPWRWR